MSVESTMYVRNNLTPRDTLEMITNSLTERFLITERSTDSGSTFDATNPERGFIFCRAASSRIANHINNRLGFSPNISITFKATEYLENQFIHFVNNISEDATWDIVLLMYDSFILLVKRGTEFELSENQGYWNPKQIELVKFPYKFRYLEDL